MGFTENQLTEIYVAEMMPLVKYPEGLIPLDQAYTKVLRLLGEGYDIFGYPLSQTHAQAEHLKRLRGQQVIAAAPIEWYNAETVMAAELFEHQWQALPIESRARWRATKRLQGMVSFIERYRDDADAEQRRRSQKK